MCNRKINTDVLIYNSVWKIGPFKRLNHTSLLSHIITLNPFFHKNNQHIVCNECFYFFYFAVCLEFCPCVAGGSGEILSRLNCHILTQPNSKTDHCDDDKDSGTCLHKTKFRSKNHCRWCWTMFLHSLIIISKLIRALVMINKYILLHPCICKRGPKND